MPQDDDQIVDSLILPPRNELQEDSRYEHWLKLADVALIRAREEQALIKEKIRPHVENYRRFSRRTGLGERSKKIRSE